MMRTGTGSVSKGYSFYSRPGTSDHMVVLQVAHEYPPLVSALLRSGIPIRTVLDAGANIGCSTHTLASGLPEATVVGLEPDADNYAMLCLNTRGLHNAVPLRAALWAPGSKHVQLFNGTNTHTSRQWCGTYGTEPALHPPTAVPFLAQAISDFASGGFG